MAAYDLLRRIEGKLHFLAIVDDQSTPAARLDRYSLAVERAQRFVDLMLTCLQPDERDPAAREACEKLVGSEEYRPRDHLGRTAVALQLVDQVAIELLRLTPEHPRLGLLPP